MENSKKESDKRYEFVAPDGGWGYVVVIGCSVIVGLMTVAIPIFALIFGPFLAQLNDETNAITTVTSIFGTLFYTTGLLSNFLLQRLSHRVVVLIGTATFCIGSFASIFASGLQSLIISYGILQGLGTGVTLPCLLSVLNLYFDRKKMLIIIFLFTMISVVNAIYPSFIRLLSDTYGFRGTQAIVTAISFHIICGSLVLHPVKRHMKRKPKKDIIVVARSLDRNTNKNTNEELYVLDNWEVEEQSLLDNKISEHNMENNVNCNPQKANKEKQSCCKQFSLLMDPSYWNMAVGLSLCIISEINFIAVLPVILGNSNFSNDVITLMMTTYFMADLIAKVTLGVITYFQPFSSRNAFLIDITIAIVFRIVFTEMQSFWCRITMCALLGCCRSIIDGTFSLVVAEAYPEEFNDAVSICMLLTGIISVIFGNVIGFVKRKTENDKMVLHVLTIALLICCISWTTELVYKHYRMKKKTKKKIYTPPIIDCK